MAVSQVSFDVSSRYACDMTSLATVISSILTAITTEASHWSVNDSGSDYIELAPAAGDNTNQRVLICGGNTPNAAALSPYDTASSAYLYVCLAPDANTTGPDQSYTVGDPYTSRNTGLVVSMQYSSSNPQTYDSLVVLQCADYIWIYFYDQSTSLMCNFLAAGEIGVDTNGDAIPAVLGCTTSGIDSQSWWTATNDVDRIIPTSTAVNAAYTKMVGFSLHNTTEVCHYLHAFPMNANRTDNLLDSSDTERYYLPIHMCYRTQGGLQYYAGTMRQMKIGYPRTALVGIIKSGESVASAWSLSADTRAAQEADAIYLTNDL